MAATRVSLLIFVVALLGIEYADSASHHVHVHAPAPAVDCSSLILNMADCLSFVSNGSTATKPEGTCCEGLKTVLKADAGCLCEAFKSSAQLGVVLNTTKAMSLPAACKLSAPAATNCGLTEAPAGAPGMSPGSTPSTGGGSAATAPAASPGSSSSGSSAVLASAGSVAIGIALVSFFSF